MAKMTKTIPEVDSLIDLLKLSNVDIYFFTSLPDIPRGYKLEDMNFTVEDNIEEDRFTYNGYYDVDEYLTYITQKVTDAKIGIENKLSRLGDFGRDSLIKDVLDRLVNLHENLHHKAKKWDVTYRSDSNKIDDIINNNFADPIDLLTNHNKSELYRFREVKMVTLKTFIEYLSDSENFKKDNGKENNGDVITTKDSKSDSPEYFTTSELAEYLRVSERAIADWRSEGKISFSKIGRKIIYSKSEVDEFLAKHKIKRYK